MSSEGFDVVIVGGAAIGSATAYFLTHDLGEHERRILGYLEERLRELSQRAPESA